MAAFGCTENEFSDTLAIAGNSWFDGAGRGPSTYGLNMIAIGKMLRQRGVSVNEKCHEFITEGKNLAVVTISVFGIKRKSRAHKKRR